MKIVDRFNQILNPNKLPIAHYTIYKILIELDLDIKIFYDMHGTDTNLLVDTDLESVDKLAVDLAVISVADHPWNNFADAKWFEKLHTINTPVLVINAYETNQEIEIYCPIYAIMYSRKNLSVKLESSKISTDAQAQSSNRHFFISCINNKPKVERLLNLLEIYKRHTTFLITLYAEKNHYPELLQQSLTESRQVLSEFDYDLLINNIVDKMPIRIEKDELILEKDFSHPAYYNSFINIINEYDFFYDKPFFSEKTIKPLLAGQFFCMLSSAGTLRLLESMGVDTYRDIIDHNKYEDSNNFAKYGLETIKSLHNYLETLSNLNWAEIYYQTLERRMQNRELILSGDIEYKFVQKLKNKIHVILN